MGEVVDIRELLSILKQDANKLSQRDELQPGGGGGTSGGVTNDWKAGVDRQLEQLHGDVRNLLYGLIGGFLLLAGGGWVAYDKLNDQLVASRIEATKALGDAQTRSAELNGKLDVLLERKTPAR